MTAFCSLEKKRLIVPCELNNYGFDSEGLSVKMLPCCQRPRPLARESNATCRPSNKRTKVSGDDSISPLVGVMAPPTEWWARSKVGADLCLVNARRHAPSIYPRAWSHHASSLSFLSM